MSIFRYQSKPSEPSSTQALVIHIPPRIESKSTLFDLLASGLKFPDYFGRNWDALDECLSDLSWLNYSKVVFIHADIPFGGQLENQKIYLILIHGISSENTTVRLEAVFPIECQPAIEKSLNTD